MGVDDLLARRPAPSSASREPFTGVVVRSDVTGVWVARLGADRRHPLGPCRGGTRVRSRTAAAGGDPHEHDVELEQLPVGTEVLLIRTGDGPWVAAHHHPGS